MIIRKATLKDSKAIAPLLLLAMEDIIYTFINTNDYQKAIAFLLHFIAQENNQYSYQNCVVAEQENQIIAAVNIYDGAKLIELRNPIIAYIHTHFNPAFCPEAETQAGEFYIDCLGVNPNQQGKGIGSQLLAFLIQEYVVQNQKIVGLLVDDKNPQAKKLYLKLGFKSVGKKSLVGKTLEHLQITSNSSLF
ncbi:MAG: GNAT family N-acetyltransferase [Flavobacterium sp.]